jgi:hypothetical protein
MVMSQGIKLVLVAKGFSQVEDIDFKKLLLDMGTKTMNAM